MSAAWAAVAAGVRLSVRVTPNASRNAIEGVETRPGAGAQLRVRVRALADKGRANTAVIALLAEALNLPASILNLVSGATARDKIIEIDGDSEQLQRALVALVAAQSKGASP